MRKPFILLFFLFLLGCTTAKITSKAVPSNPVAYTFNVNIDSARLLFRDAYFRYHNAMGFDLEYKDFQENANSISSSDNKGKVQRKNGELTAYIVVTTDSSTVYRRTDGKAVPYSAECRLHFVPVEKDKVEVSVEVLSAWVILGKQRLPSIPHFVQNDKVQYVKPTTIEEYKLLLCFGKGLGIADQMPALKTL
ncbi:MAG: hypothetical protein EOO18_01345 [Chryseobacterium sp.]|nr:MAG: hypothetical protein EOO18_01345 [Chryseobacterium sp.]